MKEVQKIIEEARSRGQKSLSEYESKQILARYGIPVVQEVLTNSIEEAKGAAASIGYPVVLKACSPDITHKTEKNLIALDIRTEGELVDSFQRLTAATGGEESGLLVGEMIKGDRELVIGLTRDPQLGPCVMFGLGGIFTEILSDVSFRVAPLEMRDAKEMAHDIKASKILGSIRGMEAVDMETLGRCLINLGKIGLDNPEIQEIDINPLIIKGSSPVAVDALVVLS